MRISSIALVVSGLLTTAASAAGQATVPYDHVHLAVADPEKAEAWYIANLNGHVGENPGRVAFGPRSIDATAADLKTKGVRFTAEPAPKPNQFGHRTAYVEDPSGVRIELVEHAQCAAGQASREHADHLEAPNTISGKDTHGK